MPRFRLLDPDGNDLGPFRASAAVWKPGDRIHRGAGDTLVVVRLVEALPDNDDLDGYLIVQEA